MGQSVDPIARNLFFSTLAVGVIPPLLVGFLFQFLVAGYSPSGLLPLVAITGMIPMALCVRLVLSGNERHHFSANLVGACAALAIVNLSLALILELDMVRGEVSSTSGLAIPIMVALGFAAVKIGWQASGLFTRGG